MTGLVLSIYLASTELPRLCLPEERAKFLGGKIETD